MLCKEALSIFRQFFFVRALSFEQTGSFSRAVHARKWRNSVESPASVIKVNNQILVPFPLCSPQKRTISEHLLVFFSFLCSNYLIQIVFEVSDIVLYRLQCTLNNEILSSVCWFSGAMFTFSRCGRLSMSTFYRWKEKSQAPLRSLRLFRGCTGKHKQIPLKDFSLSF